MAGFVFPLERVLRYRERIEKKQLKQFSMKRAELLEIESKIECEMKKLRDFSKRMDFQKGIFSSIEFLLTHNYVFRLEKKIEQLKREREIKREELDRELDKLNKARKERLAIEKLRDRQYQRYLQMLAKIEEKELDDINQKIGLNKEKLTIEDLPLEES